MDVAEQRRGHLQTVDDPRCVGLPGFCFLGSTRLIVPKTAAGFSQFESEMLPGGGGFPHEKNRKRGGICLKVDISMIR